jgi:hypothetical protein
MQQDPGGVRIRIQQKRAAHQIRSVFQRRRVVLANRGSGHQVNARSMVPRSVQTKASRIFTPAL